jgi:peptide/nickel transport system permease protein
LATLLVFLFLRIIPGDPALLILSGGTGEGSYTSKDLANLQHKLGTDRPLHIQYGTWIWDLLRGDLGTSYFYGIPIVDQLKVRLPVTLELTVIGILISFILAVPLGIISALKQDTMPDYVARVISFSGIAIPTFVTGIVTVYLLVHLFNWFPPLDYTPPWKDLGKNLQQMIFPALALAFFIMAFIARVTRSSMLEVLREDYIRTARAKGLREKSVIFLHALQNAFLPILTVTGWAFGVFLGGTVIIESIFLLPGMGRLLLDSIFQRDYPVIQAEIFVIASMILLLNLVIDILYGWLDPRIRFR